MMQILCRIVSVASFEVLALADGCCRREIAESLGVDVTKIEKHIQSGEAFALLAADYQDADKMRIEGSPSFVLNNGRQKLYGDVGFHLIEANIQELLRSPAANEVSWC